METIERLSKIVDLDWLINLCHQPGAKLDYLINEITLKYNCLTGEEAKKLILCVALADATIKTIKKLNTAGE